MKTKNEQFTDNNRLKMEIKKKEDKLLKVINKKAYGRMVRRYELRNLALDLVTPEHFKKLQDLTLSAEDIREQRYQHFLKKKGAISKEDFLLQLLNGELSDFMVECKKMGL